MLLLQVITDGLVFGSIYALGALGFNLIYGTTGTFHIAYGATLLVGLYIATEIGLSGGAGVVGIVVGLLVAMAIGVAVYGAFYRPMEAAGRSRLIVFVASLGLTITLEALLLIVFDAPARRFDFPGLLQAREVLGRDISWLGILSIVGALAALVLLREFLARTSLGRQIRGLAINPELAETIGIRTKPVLAFVYALGSALGFVGLFALSANTAVSSDIGTSFTLVVAVAVIAGGLGSLVGSYLVAMAFGLIQSAASVYLSGQWTLVLVYGAFIVLIVARPTGLFRGLART